MSLDDFIKINRDVIVQVVRSRLNTPNFIVSDEEYRLWVLNDEALYDWARRSGCSFET